MRKLKAGKGFLTWVTFLFKTQDGICIPGSGSVSKSQCQWPLLSGLKVLAASPTGSLPGATAAEWPELAHPSGQ